MASRIRVEYQGEDYRWYHTTAEISKHPLHEFARPLQSYEGKAIQEIGEIGAPLVKEVLNTPGVKKIFISPYCLSVMIGKAFDWKEVEPIILKALKKAFRIEFGEVVKSVKVEYLGVLRKEEKVPTEEKAPVEEEAEKQKTVLEQPVE